MLDPEVVKDELGNLLTRFKGERGDLIPILQAVQEKWGYLPEAAMLEVSRFLRLPESALYGVATFYAQFKLSPTGRSMVKVCRGTACHVRGASKILEEVKKRLGINPGGTTPDLEYSLETVACFGSCALAPVMVVDQKVYGRMTGDKAKQILSG